jgi:hypothetical protein
MAQAGYREGGDPHPAGGKLGMTETRSWYKEEGK